VFCDFSVYHWSFRDAEWTCFLPYAYQLRATAVCYITFTILSMLAGALLINGFPLYSLLQLLQNVKLLVYGLLHLNYTVETDRSLEFYKR
jgi:hypothetical protein